MDLQIALIILGLLVVFMVFAVSRYSNKLEKYWHALRNNTFVEGLLNSGKRGSPGPNPDRSGRSRHNADHAPKLGDSASEYDPSEEQLFEFESDSFAQPHPENQSDEAEVDQLNRESEPVDVEVQAVELAAEPEPEMQPLPTLRDDTDELSSQHIGPFTSLRQIDYWIKLSPASPVTQAEILSKLGHWNKIRFPVQLHALTRDDPHWVNLLKASADTSIVDVVASYQLLTGGNATDIADLNTFDEQVTILGQVLHAEKLMMANPEQALDQSLKLARFFADSYEPLEVSIYAPEGQAFMGKLVETSAKQQGLDFMDGDYVRQKRMASHNIILYRMLNIDSTHNIGRFDENMSSDASIKCVKFIMQPALSRTPGRDAKEMLDAVKAFASRVNGDIRIPGEAEYHQDLLLKLRNRVSRLEKDTIAAGLEPGGQEIYRIFS
jgi:FtsZ-interacting cell division protein ZipA